MIVAKQLQELPYEKRQGNSVARAWINKLTFDLEKSTSEACSLLSLLDFVPKTAKALDQEPDVVLQRLEEVRQYRKLLGISTFQADLQSLTLPSCESQLPEMS